MDGINLSDPDFLRDCADSLREVLGDEWIEQQVHRIRESEPEVDELLAVQGFERLPAWLRHLRRSTPPEDAQEMLEFGMIAFVVTRSRSLPGWEGVARELRRLARLAVEKEEPQPFRNTLFEARVAVYFWTALPVEGVEFGTGERPDVWASLPFDSGTRRLPVACKRISPVGARENLHSALVERLTEEFNAVAEGSVPVEARVWLHDERLGPAAVDRIMPTIEELHAEVEEAEEGAAVTASVLRNRGQVTVVRRSDASSDVRESLLTVRNNALNERVGDLEGRLRDAVRQVDRETEEGEAGGVCLGLRPPSGTGDVVQAVLTVRRLLGDLRAHHVGFVGLFFTAAREPERGRRIELPGGLYEQDVYVGRSFVPIFYANPDAELGFAPLDTTDEILPDRLDPHFPDPLTGECQRIDGRTLSRISAGEDVPDRLVEARERFREQLEEQPEKEGAETTYWKQREPYPQQMESGWFSFAEAGSRQFRSMALGDHMLLAYEMRHGRPASSVTLDLRAWVGEREFCQTFEWDSDGFSLGLELPNGDGERVVVRAADLPAVS